MEDSTFCTNVQPGYDMKYPAQILAGLCNIPAMRFRVRLKEFRERLGLSQAALAEKANVSFHVITKYEQNKGGLSSLQKIENLATALNIHPISLISDEWESFENIKAQGVDQKILSESIGLAMKTIDDQGYSLTPEKMAELAVIFYQARIEKMTDPR